MKRLYRPIRFLMFVTLADGLTKSCQSTSYEMGQTQKQACRAECTRVCSRAVGHWQQKRYCRCVLQSELQPGLIWEIHYDKVQMASQHELIWKIHHNLMSTCLLTYF